eukprot:6200391-Pleurochrysis_carterae.AAC.1
MAAEVQADAALQAYVKQQSEEQAQQQQRAQILPPPAVFPLGGMYAAGHTGLPPPPQPGNSTYPSFFPPTYYNPPPGYPPYPTPGRADIRRHIRRLQAWQPRRRQFSSTTPPSACALRQSKPALSSTAPVRSTRWFVATSS